MSGLWVRSPGEGVSEYGPLSLEELRTMVAAGLIFENTLVRDEVSAPRVLSAWPELAESLANSAIRRWVPRVAGMESAAIVFEEVNDTEAGGAPSVLDVLAVNLAHEPPKIVVMPPWYRWPLVRNIIRYFGLILPVVGLSALYWRHNHLSLSSFFPLREICLIAFNSCLVGGWAWMVWVIAPARWTDK